MKNDGLVAPKRVSLIYANMTLLNWRLLVNNNNSSNL